MNNSNGWVIKRIGELTETFGGSTPSTLIDDYWYNGTNLWATPTDITSLESKYISETSRKITQIAIDENSQKIFPKGTVLMTSRATIGYPAIATKPISTNQGFINIKCSIGLYNLFLYYWIIKNRELIKRFAHGSTFPELSKKDFRKFYIDLPPLPEQRQIAEILSTVDDAIEKTDAIINETQELKKGLMQKLFTEGIGHTQYRETKIGRIPEEWELIKLEKVAKIQGGFAFKSGDLLQSGKYQVIRIGNLYQGKFNLNREPVFLNNPNDQQLQFLAEKNDLLTTMTGTIGKRDFGWVVKIQNEENLLVNQRVCRISPFENFINYEFLYHICFSKSYLDQFFMGGRGGTGNQTNVGVTDIANIFIPKPPPDEQVEISDILSTADFKIKNEELNREYLVKLKKALMQVLLTGKVRVKI